MTKEIEKKYLLSSIPEDIVWESESEIHQTYLALGDEEVRVRKKINNQNERYTLTMKKGSGLSREEIETEISLSTYNQLLSSTTKRALIKTRKTTKLLHEGLEYLAEIDIYKDIDDLIVVEIEFESEISANKFEKPLWFGEDVTEDKRLKNQNLWASLQ